MLKRTPSNRYTKADIQAALDTMQGFVDISVDDAHELLKHLEKNHQNQLKKQKKKRRARAVTYGLLKWRRRFSIQGSEVFFSWLFSFIGIASLGLLHQFEPSFLRVIGSFGASAVLAYGIPRSPLAQPRNIVGGHVVSAIIGVCIHMLFPHTLWLASALAVSLAIAAMHLTKTLHPPGGATALIAIIGGEKIYSLGFFYILSPVLLGATLIVITAFITNNNVKGRHYPDKWW